MRRWFFIFLFVSFALAGTILAPVFLADPGQVILAFGNWELDMPLVVWVLAIVMVWVILSVAWSLVRLPGRLIEKRRRDRSRRQLEQGFLALTEGEWSRAEQSFAQSLSYQKSTAGLLGAARAAQGRSDIAARDAWLAQAQGRFGRRHFVTEFARARLAIDEGRLDQAIEILEQLHLKKGRHLGVLRTLLSAYQDSGRWREVRELAPALKRAGMVDAEKAESLVRLAAERELGRCDGPDALRSVWRALPKSLQKDRSLVLAYAQRAEMLGHYEHATRLLSGLLDHGVDEELLQAYRLVDDADRATRIVYCEKQLKKDPNQKDFLETLGFLYLDDRQYEKAQRCLEQAMKQKSSKEMFIAMGRLMDRQGDPDSAARYYRNALQFSAHGDQRLLENGK
jgi:HemY protein